MEINRTTHQSVALIACLSVSGLVLAAETLSLDEAKVAAAAKFDKLNKDGDSTLDADEARTLLGDKAFKAADTDDDGSLDKQEFLALAEKLFQRADVDRDGRVDTNELNGPNGKRLKRLLR